jgi:GNAT superfamily N-acetyltransferase
MAVAPIIEVRQLQPSDWPVLRNLRLKALQDAPFAFFGDLAQETAWPAERWKARFDHCTWFTAVQGGRSIGLVAAVRDPDTDDHYVESMWIEPAGRGQGAASALLQAVEQLALREQKSILKLWVLDRNPAASEVYRRYGFNESGRRQALKNHPGVAEVEFRMSLPSGHSLPGTATLSSLFAAP